jgi:UDP-N-acetylmuramoylalanine--D-glutamate ligase
MRNVCVIGLGKSGFSTVNYLLKKYPNDKLCVIDTRQNVPNLEEVEGKLPIHTGSFNQEWMNNADLLIVSPGVDIRQPEFKQAEFNNTEIIGDVEFFAQELLKKDKYPSIISITGSNGKSTVTTLCYEVLKANGVNVSLGGNIGVPVLDVIDNDFDAYVLELSSFQLETLKSLKPTSAVHLNLSPDHLDRYDSYEDYNLAKHNVFNNTKLAIFNQQDSFTNPKNNFNKVSFGTDNSEYYIKEIDNKSYLYFNNELLLNEDEIKLVGQHNLLNILAVYALISPLKLDKNITKKAICKYAGLDHRCQLAYFNNGVKWINDSKATNIGSLVACLDGLKVNGKLHLLMGGDGKGADFTELKPLLNNFDLQLYCFGKDKLKLAELSSSSIIFATMEEAMHKISQNVKANDIVLLSPACASIDQFKNFEVRGEEFTKLAKQLG